MYLLLSTVWSCLSPTILIVFLLLICWSYLNILDTSSLFEKCVNIFFPSLWLSIHIPNGALSRAHLNVLMNPILSLFCFLDVLFCLKKISAYIKVVKVFCFLLEATRF